MVFDELLALIYHEYTATPFQAMESTKKKMLLKKLFKHMFWMCFTKFLS